MNARLLILDEPTSSLTSSDAERLFDVLRDLRSAGTAIVYISHRLKEIEMLADRAVVLRDGRNAGTLEREAISHDRLVQLMVGRAFAACRRSRPAGAAPDRVRAADRAAAHGPLSGRRGLARPFTEARSSESPG